MSEYYGLDGQPMDMNEWATARSDETWKRAKRETKTDDATVSTVWLGLDHNFGDDGPPLIFESMVFGGGLDQETVRYSTLDEAHAGHERLVEKVRVEADAFRGLVADPEVAAAVRLIEDHLAAHLSVFGTYDYDGRAYSRLVDAVSKAATS